MLDSTHQFTLPSVPHILLYEDSELAERFYAVPKMPRLQEENGKPVLNLLIYGKGKNPDFQITGGMLTLSLSLSLTPQEKANVLRGLTERLKSLSRPNPLLPSKPPSLEVVSPEWIDGEVQVTVGELTQNAGSPSLFGENNVSVSLTLDATQAETILKSWKDGSLALTARYAVRAVALQQEGHKTDLSHESNTTKAGFTASTQKTQKIQLAVAKAVAFPMILSGTIPLPETVREEQLQTVSF